MHIRKAQISDIDTLLLIYTEQFEAMQNLQPYFFQSGDQSKEFIKSVIESNESDILVCMDHDSIQAFVLLQEKETPSFPFFVQHKFVYLMDIVTTKDNRGRGYGNALINEAKNWGLERNLEYIELDVLSNNDGAIRFYKNHDFGEKRQTLFCSL